MKKIIKVFFISAVLTFVFALAGCGVLKYNVDFYVDGQLYATVGTNGKEIKMPSDPEKDGCVFRGWFLDEEGEGEALTISALLDQPLSEDVHLKVYASFGEPVTVTFYTNTEETILPQTIASGDSAEKVTPKIIPDGKIFGGWFTDEQYSMKWDFSRSITEDISLYGLWLDETVTVTYDFCMSGVQNEVRILENGELAESITPEVSPADKEFYGWFTDKECTQEWNFYKQVTEDITLYACWLGDYVTITYDYNYGQLGSKTEQVRRDEIFSPLPPEVYPPYFEFDGWFKDKECNIGWWSDIADRNLTIYAGWRDVTGEQASVWYVYPDQTEHINGVVGEKASEVDFVVPKGFEFIGWFRDQNFTVAWDFDTDRIDARELTLYAKFEKIRSKIYFDVSYPFSAVETMDVEYGQTVTFPNLQTDYYYLAYWQEMDEEGNVTVYSDGREYGWYRTEDVTLTALIVSVFTFNQTADGTAYTVTGTLFESVYYKPRQNELIVPGEYNGKPVIGVEYGAFRNCGIRRLVVSEGIRSIGKESFSSIYELEEIVLPSSLEEIGDSAFEDCRSLTAVRFAENGNLKTIARYAFASCESLQSIVLPSYLETLGYNAFNMCVSLLSVDLGSGVHEIGGGAFGHCLALKVIEIPTQIEVMDSNVFSRYSTSNHDLLILTELKEKPEGWSEFWNSGLNVVWGASSANIVTEDNFLFCIQNGIAKLLRYTEQKQSSITVPASIRYENVDYPVTVFGNYVFEHMENLTELILPDTLEYVGTNVFHRTENLDYNIDGNASYLGSTQNPYLLLARFEGVSAFGDPLTVRAKTKIILENTVDSVYDVSELIFEENSSLTQIGPDALHVNGRSIITLPEGILYMGEGALMTEARIFVSEQSRPDSWDENWCFNGRVYWGAKENLVEREDGLFMIEGETVTLVQCNVQQDEYTIPQSIGHAGKTYPVNRIGKSAMETARCRTVFIPSYIEYFEENWVAYGDVGQYCIEEAQQPETWSEFWNRNSNYFRTGVTPENYEYVNGVHYILHEGYAEAYRYTGGEDIFVLPRTIQAQGSEYPVSEVSASFISSLENIHIIFFDSVERIGASKHYGYGVYIYTTYESDPIGWEFGWNATYFGSIPVYYGLKGVDGTLRNYSFVTEGTPVESMTAVMIPTEPKTEKTDMYFWGWYDNANFEGKPIEFPYTGSSTVLYARFESEQIKDGKGFDTAFVIEEGLPVTVDISKPGQSVFFVIKIPKGMPNNYVFKSIGEMDTYGIIYNLNYNQIAAADSGGSGDNFSITKSFGSVSTQETYYFEVKLLDKSETGSFNILLSRA